MTAAGKTADSADDDLWQLFVDPPDAARPRAWWHWMDGNIDPAGIVRDLTWLHGAGIRGVQLFDGGMGVPLVVPEPVRPESAAWTEAIDTAIGTADRLGLELAVATSSGWSAAGGPWVRPDDAMKKVVWSETVVAGGGAGRVPARSAAIRTRAVSGQPSLGRIGCRALHDRLARGRHAPRCDAGRARAGRGVGIRGRRGLVVPRRRRIRLVRVASARSRRDIEAWIEQRFAEPVTVRSVVGRPAGSARIRRGAAARCGAAGGRRRRRVSGHRPARGVHRPGPFGRLPSRHRSPLPAGALRRERGRRPPVRSRTACGSHRCCVAPTRSTSPSSRCARAAGCIAAR